MYNRLLDVLNEEKSVYLVFEHLDFDLLTFMKGIELPRDSQAIKVGEICAYECLWLRVFC